MKDKCKESQILEICAFDSMDEETITKDENTNYSFQKFDFTLHALPAFDLIKSYLRPFRYVAIILLLLPNAITTWIYLKNVDFCEGLQIQCIKRFYGENVKIYFLSFLCIGFVWAFQLFFYYKFKLFSLWLKLFMVIDFFFIFFYDNGADEKHHGGVARVLVIIFILLGIAILLTVSWIIRGFRKFPVVVVLSLSLLYISLYYKVYQPIKKDFDRGCDYWSSGLGGVTIDNLATTCHLSTPSSCPITAFDGYFDMSRILGVDCSSNNKANSYELLQQYFTNIKKNATVIGFPRAEKWNYQSTSYLTFQKNVLNNLIDMDDLSEANKPIRDQVEVVINFTAKEAPKIQIEIKKNDTLVEERRKRFEKHGKKTMARNVIYMFFDSMSRPQVRKKLPKTFKWLEKFYVANGENNSEDSEVNPDANANDYESFQFLKYHSAHYFTASNVIPIFWGLDIANYYKTENHYFVSDYANAGYITAQTFNFCDREIFDYEVGMTVESYEYFNYDHSLDGLMCDPNFSNYQKYYTLTKGPFSIFKRCFYEKLTTDYGHEYATKFWEAYIDEPKFLRISNMAGHEGTLETVKYEDESVVRFLENMEKKGYLKNTILFLNSDHGMYFLGPYSVFQTEDYNKESMLSFLFIVADKKLPNYYKLRDVLKANEQMFVTPYNLYNSFLHIVGNDDHRSPFTKLTLISHKIPSFINCRYFWTINWCKCV